MESRERYDELCRLCASYDAVKMDIFGQEGKNRQLVDKIQTCLPFKIAENDRLPKCLCYRCMYNLENFYDFRTACVNAVALLERSLPPKEHDNGDVPNNMDKHSKLRSELLKEKEKMPILIPEAPIVNPNAALGTPPRLNSDGEADQEIEEILEQSGTEEGIDEDRKSEEYEMDMETNPSDFLEMPPMITEDTEETESHQRQQQQQHHQQQKQYKQKQKQNRQINSQSSGIFQHTLEQHEVYVCSLCNKAFSSKGHLSLHARIHVGAGDVIGEKVITDDHTSYKRPYQCDLCNKSYSTAKHRWGHVSTTHRGHPAVTCRYCSRIYSTRTNLEEHIKSRHTGLPPPIELPMPFIQQDNRYQCKLCPKMYTNITELNKHSRVCLGDRTTVAATTTTPTSSSTSTAAATTTILTATNKTNNRRNHSDQLKPKGKSLMDTSDASSVDSDDDSKDYRSAEAKLSKNPQLTILKQALTRRDGIKDVNKRSKLITDNNERRDDNNFNSKKWYCESCPKSFISIEGLKEHELSHESEKPYFCILCEKDFVLKSSLSRHILTSHGVDPAPIIDSDKCLKKTLINSNIYKHKSRVNELKNKRDGSDCSYSSEHNNIDDDDHNSNQDPNIIEIETVFVCEICTRDFNDRASLWLHIRATHKEYAAFACGICLKICSDNEQLLNHVNMYHGGSKLLVSEQRRYSCTICGRQHDSRKKLMTHVSIHNIDPNFDPAAFVQLNSNYYNENLNSNEIHEQSGGGGGGIGIGIGIGGDDFDNEDGDKVDCFICYKSFPNEDHLIRHQRNAHKSEPLSINNEFGHSNGTSVNPTNGSKAQYHLFFVCEICGSSHQSKWERWLHVSNIHSDEPTIRCDRPDCAKIFATKSLKNDHIQHHLLQGESPNTCEICGKLWGSRVDYWKHVMGVHSDTVPLICGVCLKVFPDVIQLSNHVKTNHWPLTNGDFSCDICGRPYSNKSKMSRHRKIHGLDIIEVYNNGIINEPINNDTTINMESNNSHHYQQQLPQQRQQQQQSHHNQDVDLTCEMCSDTIFINWEDLCQHRRLVHGLFPCDLCNKCYGRTSHLWKHVNRVHKGHKDVTCKYCMKTSASKDHLAAHIAKIHRYEPDTKHTLDDNLSNLYKSSSNIEEESIHHCEKCNKGFHKRYLLRRHMKGCQNYRKDPGALLTRCRACERIFKDRASLQKHIENHHSSYTCHLCNETVTSKLGIMTHNRINHMSHPDITCEHNNCKKLFRTKEDLEAHRKDHKYHNSPNVCDFCGDTVDNKLKLKMHILSLHRNEIGVSCGVCLIPMKDPQELKKHVEKSHPGVLDKPNTCQVCGKQYASKWKAFDHTKKCHGKVYRTCKQCLAVFITDDDIRHHYEFVHNIPKDQLAGYENNMDLSSRNDDNDTSGIRIKEEPDDEYDDYYNIPFSKDPKRKRNDDETYDCEMCHEIFINYTTLTQHYRTIHNTDPERMYKKLKMSNGKRKMRNRENFECKNCKKQFCTKTLYWNHINICTRKNNTTIALAGAATTSPSVTTTTTAAATTTTTTTPPSILESHLKNNNQIKKEPMELLLNENNLNIPDFNLFEDINLQLSGQKPVPNLMPLTQVKISQSNNKCYRKDSRKVYDESTNTVCACEVCGKQWPAKKHLWQHLIRFHRAEAAVTCGVCLKLCNTYKGLSQHLKDTHEAILSCEGNNFTCKICGRYHNARSKLLLHMSIHINNEQFWCDKCAVSFDNEDKLEQHLPNCNAKKKEIQINHDRIKNIKTEVKSNEIEAGDSGSLIGDGASLTGEGEHDNANENENGNKNINENANENENDNDNENVEEEEEEDFDSEEVEEEEEEDEVEDEEHSDGDSDNMSNVSENEENEMESRTNSRVTGDLNSQTDSEDQNLNESYEEAEEQEEVEEEEEVDDNDGKDENIEEDVEKPKTQNENISENSEVIEKDKSVNNSSKIKLEKNTKTEMESDDEDEGEGGEEEEEEEDDGPPVLSPIIPINEVSNDRAETLSHKLSPMASPSSKKEDDNDDSKEEEEMEENNEGNIEEMEQMEVDHGNDNNSISEGEEGMNGQNDHLDEETEEYEGELDGNAIELGNDVRIEDLDGTVLMVTNDAEGNQILIQQNVSGNEDSIEAITRYIYQEDNGIENYDGQEQPALDDEEAEEEEEEDGGGGDDIQENQDYDEEGLVVVGEFHEEEEEEEEEDEGEIETDGVEVNEDMEIQSDEEWAEQTVKTDDDSQQSDDIEANSSAKNHVSRT